MVNRLPLPQLLQLPLETVANLFEDTAISLHHLNLKSERVCSGVCVRESAWSKCIQTDVLYNSDKNS